MGTYINPGNYGFAGILRKRYVDKTGLAVLFNGMLHSPDKLVCMSRPRRFGKSFAAEMLVAYYSCGCDSRELFEGLDVSRDPSFEEHLNAYNVVRFDVSAFTGRAGAEVVPELNSRLLDDARAAFPDLSLPDALDLALLTVVRETGRKLVFVIDEWDAVIREAAHDAAAQDRYLKFLRGLFKNADFTGEAVAGAYMTGILPIKKDGSQSAVSDFREYTVFDPEKFAGSIGFTQAEVEELCAGGAADFAEMKRWYDGYQFGDEPSVYNPNSVMRAYDSGKYRSYWTQTSAADSLKTYISMDFGDLQRDVADLLAGNAVEFDTGGFENDVSTFRTRDDVLACLTHLGYLTYDWDAQVGRIPNEELRLEFARTVRGDGRAETVERVRASDRLIADTVAMHEDAVAAAIEKMHEQEANPLFYNNEQSLRAVLKLAYFCYKEHYLQLEELPGGAGFADVVYLPKKRSPYPALVVELKWDDTARTAIDQIRERDYPAALEGFGGEILLVGISYDKSDEPGKRTHRCRIERV